MTDITVKPKFYLTTPIYYANSRPHVGSAYTTIACDALARYQRMCGREVAYVTGTDEHGVNIERAAEKLGISPRELVGRNCAIFQELWKLLGIGYTHFVRTTSAEHARAVQALVRRTRSRSPDAIYKAKYEGRYCVYDNLYVSDSPEPANCPICDRPAELISEENYFFRLSAYQEQLLRLYREQPDIVQPDFRMNEVRSFVEAGLKDVSISRKAIKWGIPWPDDPDHVFYVWYDALTSYMSAIGFGEGAEGERAPEFQRFWPADVHMIGKEIIRFHAVYWPAFLLAAGLPLPRKIFAHGWLLFEQEKMSKSKGNVAYAEPIVKSLDELAGAQVGNDTLRYYLLRETVFGQDGNFSREALLKRYEADLVNGLGNLASRILAMIETYFGGRVPQPATAGAPKWFAQEEIRRIVARGHYDAFRFSAALQEIWLWISEVDQYLVTEKPWKIAAEPGSQKQLAEVLYQAAEALRMITVFAHPVLPVTTNRIWANLGQSESLGEYRMDRLAWGGLKPGTRVSKPQAVFPRVESQKAYERMEAMENAIRNPEAARSATAQALAQAAAAGAAPGAQASSPEAPAQPGAKIGIEDFAKVELRVGVVKSAERIAGADKLLKLLVDIGSETRQILAGVALAYAPEQLIGRKVVIVANLAPRKMRGLESNGMLLAASAGEDGKPVLCTFAEDVPPGAKVK